MSDTEERKSEPTDEQKKQGIKNICEDLASAVHMMINEVGLPVSFTLTAVVTDRELGRLTAFASSMSEAETRSVMAEVMSAIANLAAGEAATDKDKTH